MTLINRSGRPLSAWGILLRRARELHGVSLAELSTRLGITKSYLGQSEHAGNNTKIMPRKWWGEIITALPSLDREQLERAAAEETGHIVLETKDLSHDQQEAAILFAANLHQLTKESCFRLREFLTKLGESRGSSPSIR